MSTTDTKRVKRPANSRPLQMVAVESLKKDTWDRGLPGFGVRVSKGAKSWAVMYRVDGRLHRMTIKNALVMPYAEARAKAVEILGKAARGEDPKAAEPKPDVVTVTAAVQRYMALHVSKNLAARTIQGKRDMFERDVLPHWGDRPIASLTELPAVIAIFDRVSERGPISGNRTLEALLAFTNWCYARKLISAPLVVDKKLLKAKETERERVLDRSDEDESTLEDKVEIRAFWQACDAIGAPFGHLFKLLLLTAQRRDEVREMDWKEVNLEKRLWTIPAARAKNVREHRVTLSDMAVAVLEQIGVRDAGLVFPAEYRRTRAATEEAAVSGHAKAKTRLDAEMAKLLGRGFERFTLHDLRRTAATEMADMGIAPHVVDKLLNHKSGTIRGVAKIYNRHEYRAEQRDALIRWGKRLAAIVGEGEAAEVVELRARA